MPGDIDIQLRVGKQEAIDIVNELFAKLEKFDKNIKESTQKNRRYRDKTSTYAGSKRTA